MVTLEIAVQRQAKVTTREIVSVLDQYGTPQEIKDPSDCRAIFRLELEDDHIDHVLDVLAMYHFVEAKRRKV